MSSSIFKLQVAGLESHKSAGDLKAYIMYKVFCYIQLCVVQWSEILCLISYEGGFFIGGRRYRWDSVRPPDVSHANLLDANLLD